MAASFSSSTPTSSLFSSILNTNFNSFSSTVFQQPSSPSSATVPTSQVLQSITNTSPTVSPYSFNSFQSGVYNNPTSFGNTATLLRSLWTTPAAEAGSVLSQWAVIGIIFGLLVAVILIAVFVYCCCSVCRQGSRDSSRGLSRGPVVLGRQEGRVKTSNANQYPEIVIDVNAHEVSTLRAGTASWVACSNCNNNGHGVTATRSPRQHISRGCTACQHSFSQPGFHGNNTGAAIINVAPSHTGGSSEHLLSPMATRIRVE